MATQRFLIAPITSGLVSNPDPWLIMDDAWALMINAHSWRGKIVKRIGAKEMDTSQPADERQLFTRFRIKIGTTNGAGVLGATTVPGVVVNRIGQMFSSLDEIYTVIGTGGPATMLSTGAGVPVYHTSGGSAGQFSLTNGPLLSDVYYYPSFPVMALPSYENIAINNEQLVGFDTQFAYQYVQGAGWQILGPVPPAAGSGLWTGTDADFHWACNWRGASGAEYLLFVVNGVVADQITYWNGLVWTRFSPVYDSATGRVIRTGKIILPFKGRLLLMNTTEQGAAGDATFTNRVRFSQIGDPTIAATAWDEVVVGRGGFIDMTTRESITSAQYIKDRLIIFCERTTWELVYTGNEVLPFRFQQINPELGVESIKSLIPFDKQVLGFGSTGIHSCNGMNVTRIDEQIPSTIFDILNGNNGPERVQGVRDYYTEEAYWSFTNASSGIKFPNQLLVYNYKTSAWSEYDESITAFGYYQANNSVLWEDLTSTWADGDEQWSDPEDISLFRQVTAGNQEGFTFTLSQTKTSNSISLSITNITVVNNIATLVVFDHNLRVGQFINIQNVVGLNGLNSDDINYRVNTVTNSNVFGIRVSGLTGAYLGGGTIERVDQIILLSKQYNFFNQIGKKIHVPRIDFLIDTIEDGKIALDFEASFSSQLLVVDGFVTGANVGNYILDLEPLTPQEESATKIWRSVYPLLEGSVAQVLIAQNTTQMLDANITNGGFRLHAMLFHVRPISDFGY